MKKIDLKIVLNILPKTIVIILLVLDKIKINIQIGISILFIAENNIGN